MPGLVPATDFVIDLLAQGWSEREILRNYPGLTPEDLRACRPPRPHDAAPQPSRYSPSCSASAGGSVTGRLQT